MPCKRLFALPAAFARGKIKGRMKQNSPYMPLKRQLKPFGDRSGYLQRCLIKLLEGLVVHHDFTVRYDSSKNGGAVVEFVANFDHSSKFKSSPN